MSKPIKWEFWLPTNEGLRLAKPMPDEKFDWARHRYFYGMMATDPLRSQAQILDHIGHWVSP